MTRRKRHLSMIMAVSMLVASVQPFSVHAQTNSSIDTPQFGDRQEDIPMMQPIA